MPDPIVNKWKQSGKVYLWKYKENTKNYPGWHLHADDEGCASLLILIDSMKKAQFPSERTLNIKPPTPKILMVPNNRGGKAKWVTVDKIKIKAVKGDSSSEEWSLIHDHPKLFLTVGENMLKAFEKGIKDITKGKGDYSIGHEKETKEYEPSNLWFWW